MVTKVSIAEKWRLSLVEAAALCGIAPNYLRELLRKREFPTRVHVGDADGGKLQFIASEVRAWAEGRDWRSMVEVREKLVAHA